MKEKCIYIDEARCCININCKEHGGACPYCPDRYPDCVECQADEHDIPVWKMFGYTLEQNEKEYYKIVLSYISENKLHDIVAELFPNQTPEFYCKLFALIAFSVTLHTRPQVIDNAGMFMCGCLDAGLVKRV